MTESIVCTRCGLVDDYRTEKSGPHIKAICNGCDRYIKFLPQGNEEPTLHFGKYKTRTIKSMTSPDETSYLRWILGNLPKLGNVLRTAITDHLINTENN